MQVRIYSPAKTAMQSGRNKTGQWVVEFEPQKARKIESLMGYTSSRDMNSQVKLKFSSLEAAEAYCKKEGLSYLVHAPHQPRRKKVVYADNFSYDRAMPWTH